MTHKKGERQLEILIFGFGAIGGFFAFILNRNENVSLSIVARSNYETVKKDGIKIQSENHGEHVVTFDNVYKTPSEAGRKFDYIICSHKAINPESAPPLFKDVASDDTTFVIIQNGAGNEDPFRKEYPKNTILSVVTWTAVTQISPGTFKQWVHQWVGKLPSIWKSTCKPLSKCLRYMLTLSFITTSIKIEETHLGLFPNPDVESSLERSRLDQFVELLRIGGTKYEVHEDVQLPRWEKMIWNAVWNFTSMITQVDSHAWLESSDEAPSVTKRLMREIAEVGMGCGVPLDYGLIDRWYDKMIGIGGVYGSTYVDMKEGRPMEIDIILGTPLKKARELGIEVPVLSTLYALSMAINGRIQGSKE